MCAKLWGSDVSLNPPFTDPGDPEVPTRLVPVGWRDISARMSDGRYLYGTHTGTQDKTLYRTDINGQNGISLYDAETLLNDSSVALGAGAIVRGVFPTSTEDLIFLLVNQGSTSFRFLYKSVDGGLSFGANSPSYDDGLPVSAVGKLGAVHSPNITILETRGFLEARDGRLFYGEYNTNLASRVPGSTHDQVRLMVSLDRGDTWSAALTLNQDGSTNNVTHCHVVIQDTYTNDIYLGFGDTQFASGLIQWDGQTPWTDNLDVTAYNALDGFRSFSDDKKYIATDLLFAEDFIINPSDNDVDSTTKGIWIFDREFSYYTRALETTRSAHSMYWGLRHSSGMFLATEIIDSQAGVDGDLKTLFMYTSQDGLTWYESGEINLSTNVTAGLSPIGLFEVSGEVFIGLSAGAGKIALETVVLRAQGQFDPFKGREVLHPVYWVDPVNGIDTNPVAPTYQGYYPDAGWATLEFALEGNKVTHGSRVIVLAGDVAEDTTIAPNPSGNARPAEIGRRIQVSGMGRGASKVHLTSGSVNTLLLLAVANVSILYEDLHLYSDKADGIVMQGVADGDVLCYRAKIGSLTDINYSIQSIGNFQIEQCELTANQADNIILITAAGASGGLVVNNTLFIGGSRQINAGTAAGYTLTGRGNTHVGYRDYGISLTNASWDTDPIIEGSVFDSPVTGIAAIVGKAGLDPVGIDYNCYSDSTNPVLSFTGTQGVDFDVHSLPNGTDPLFVNTDKNLYQILASSPCVSAGDPASGLAVDIEGRVRPAVPSIGAFEG